MFFFFKGAGRGRIKLGRISRGCAGRKTDRRRRIPAFRCSCSNSAFLSGVNATHGDERELRLQSNSRRAETLDFNTGLLTMKRQTSSQPAIAATLLQIAEVNGNTRLSLRELIHEMVLVMLRRCYTRVLRSFCS